MHKIIDDMLNRITMYRLVLYSLIAIIAVAVFYGAIGILPYSPLLLLYGTGVILGLSLLFNWFFASAFNATTNAESIYITALILVLLIHPPAALFDPNFWLLAVASAGWAVASKFILARHRKHIFNPAAIGIAMPALFLLHSADWWVGTLALMPFVLVSGILITRKVRRFDLVLSFFAAALIAIAVGHPAGALASVLWRTIAYSALPFFAFFMLTEPLTTPPTRARRIVYGLFVGALFLPAAHVGSVYFTPELALVAGNILSYILSPKRNYALRLIRKELVAQDTYDLAFTADRSLRFRAGQYLEWTLGQVRANSRGNRRYFTIASAPKEREVRMGIKVYRNANNRPSAFKERLLALKPGDTILAGQLAGDFTLPRLTRSSSHTDLVFIAGGIGITPFRSMIKQLQLTSTKRNITLFYSNKTADDIAYRDVFDAAQQNGVRTVYTLTDTKRIPAGWRGEQGYVTPEMIKRYVPRYQASHFYLSGPNSMVEGFSKTLREMGVPAAHIKKDFFPGFA